MTPRGDEAAVETSSTMEHSWKKRYKGIAKYALGVALPVILATALGVTSARADPGGQNLPLPDEVGSVTVTHDVEASSVISTSQLDGADEAEAAIQLPGTTTTDSVDLRTLPVSVVSVDGPALASREIEGSVITAFPTPSGVQTFIEIPALGAPTEYRFPIDVPDGATLNTQPDGSVFVTGEDGLPLAVLDVPWALDAEGTNVPTHFRIEGDTVVQVVQPDADTAFPVIADPDFWWIVAQSAGCLAEIAALSLAAAKVVQAFAKADRIIRAAKALGRYYDALGGKMDLVIGVLKKWINNRGSLTRVQMSAIEGLVREGGKIIFNVIGLGTCYSLVTQG